MIGGRSLSCTTYSRTFPFVTSTRYFRPSIPTLDENDEAAAAAEAKVAAAAKAKLAAAEFNRSRAVYNKKVSQLRKEYASEVALQRAADQAEKAVRQKEAKRQKLERQRLKNIKSVESAMRQLEIRKQRELEFEEHLREAQIMRDARNERFRKARQLLIDELEEESPLWLTTHDEIEKAFSKTADQELWAFPNSVIGVPEPTEDSKFWNLESHTWHMNKTYKTQEEALTDHIIDKVYFETNIDKSYWTPERLSMRKELQEKAKLRAMVKDAGRRALLLKQKELLQDTFPKQSKNSQAKTPRPMPVPDVKILADEEIMEEEGVKVLLKNPTQFFEFENQPSENVTTNSKEDGSYDGPTLGAPIALKNNVRVEKALNKAYPDLLGKLPEADTRTAKEKKRDARKLAMMTAAQETSDVLDDDDDIKVGEDVDLEKVDIDGDAEWEESLDPVKDKDLFNIPRRDRYNEETVEAVISRLEKKAKMLQEQLDYELKSAQDQFQSRSDTREVSDDDSFSEEEKITIESNGEIYDLDSLGVDEDEVKQLLNSLTEEQMVALHKIDREQGDRDGSLDAAELREKLLTVDGLSNEQMDTIVRVEEILGSNELLDQDAMLDEYLSKI
mmetsp:Transcript_8336/g.12838  ORF Transcript_8336/g.12838 Transcript_8336/m.12838 type:complete len:616 (-) Transcript_8336:193-2040(-)